MVSFWLRIELNLIDTRVSIEEDSIDVNYVTSEAVSGWKGLALLQVLV